MPLFGSPTSAPTKAKPAYGGMSGGINDAIAQGGYQPEEEPAYGPAFDMGQPEPMYEEPAGPAFGAGYAPELPTDWSAQQEVYEPQPAPDLPMQYPEAAGPGGWQPPEAFAEPEPSLLEKLRRGVEDAAGTVGDMFSAEPQGFNAAVNAYADPLLSEYPGAGAIQEGARDAFGAAGSLLDRIYPEQSQMPNIGLPTLYDGSAQEAGRTIGGMVTPTTYGELALAPLIGIAPGVDDLGRAAIKRAPGAIRGGVQLADNAMRAAMPPPSGFTGSGFSAGVPPMGDDLESLLQQSMDAAPSRPVRTAPVVAEDIAAGAPPPVPAAVDDDLTEWAYSLRKLEQAEAQGPGAVAEELARERAIVAGRQATKTANERAAGEATYSTHGKQNLEDTRTQMSAADAKERAYAELEQAKAAQAEAGGANANDARPLPRTAAGEHGPGNRAPMGEEGVGARTRQAARVAPDDREQLFEAVQLDMGREGRQLTFAEAEEIRGAFKSGSPLSDDLVRQTGRVIAGLNFHAPDTRTFAQRLVDLPIDIANTMRQAVAGLDGSYALRQGLFTIRHGQEYMGSLASAAKAGADEAYALGRMAQLRTKDRHGLFLGEIPGEKPTGQGRVLSRREENYASDVINVLPGYKQIGRGNTVFLNEQRSRVYDLVEDAWTRTEGVTGWLNNKMKRTGDLEAMANYINRNTGRGTLGPLENTWLGDVMGVGMFSPRYLASRPEAFLNMFNFKHPRVAIEAVKDFAVTTGAVTALLAMANESGLASVNLDPTDSEFGKFKAGPIRIDPWAGFQQLATLGARVATGAAEGDTDELVAITERFFRSKLAPFPGTAYSFLAHNGEDFMGRKIGLEELATSWLPIFIAGMYEAAQEGLLGETLAIAPLNFFGLGGGVYRTKDDIAQELFKQDYGELPANKQARVVKELMAAGSEVTTSSQTGPYWQAKQDAFDEIRQGNPDLQGYEDYWDWHDAMDKEFRKYGFSKAERDGKFTSLENKYGITALAKKHRRAVVLEFPEILGALEAENRGVSKELRELVGSTP